MKIKNWLLAGKHNKYHPHLLRPLGLSLVVAALLGVNVLQNVVSAHSFQVLGVATNINAPDVISISNQQRAANGLPGLAYNSKLSAAAEAKARDMFAKDYWAHYAPDGTTPWSFMIAAGYSYSTAGENLAKDFDTSAGVVNGWMNSAGHRANLLNSSFVDTGVAVMNGTLQGEATTLVVAMYGAPRTAAATPAPAPTTTKPKSTAPSTTSTPKSAASTAPTTQTQEPAPTPTPTPLPAPEVTNTKPTLTNVPDKEPTSTIPTVPPTQTIDDKAVALHESRTWSQNATIFILSAVFLVSVFKHTVVWRTKKTGWRHVWMRAHPAAQYGLLLVAIVANLTSGVGVIR